MANFSLRRFGSLVACDLRENKYAYLRALGTITLAFTFINIVGLYKYYRFPMIYEELDRFRFYDLIATYWLGTCLALHIYASELFKNMQTKQKRLRFLMLPATNAEKYLSRLLRKTVFAVVLLFGGLVCADLLRLFADLFMDADIGSMLPRIFEAIREIASDMVNYSHFRDIYGLGNWWIIVLGGGIGFWVYTFYFVGSALFRKYAFVKTSVVLLVFFLLFGIVATQPGGYALGLIEPDFTFKLYAAIVVVWLAVAGNIWLSYRLFCRMQIISPKLI